MPFRPQQRPRQRLRLPLLQSPHRALVAHLHHLHHLHRPPLPRRAQQLPPRPGASRPPRADRPSRAPVGPSRPLRADRPFRAPVGPSRPHQVPGCQWTVPVRCREGPAHRRGVRQALARHRVGLVASSPAPRGRDLAARVPPAASARVARAPSRARVPRLAPRAASVGEVRPRGAGRPSDPVGDARGATVRSSSRRSSPSTARRTRLFPRARSSSNGDRRPRTSGRSSTGQPGTSCASCCCRARW